MRQNKESQQLQYAVAERVRALGWKQVEIINSDLGSSAGIASAQREGFERVLSLVALGEVGIVGSRELSRLSRTDKDWCRLLEVCQIFGTLIADEQQVYDLNYLDDQLVLGIKGTLSVVELKVLRQRLLAGQESKARRGELFKRLPIGYARDPVGKIVFHPDRRICEAIQLVFAKFRELWSVRQTFQWFRDHDVELPVNPIQGTRLVWRAIGSAGLRGLPRVRVSQPEPPAPSACPARPGACGLLCSLEPAARSPDNCPGLFGAALGFGKRTWARPRPQVSHRSPHRTGTCSVR